MKLLDWFHDWREMRKLRRKLAVLPVSSMIDPKADAPRKSRPMPMRTKPAKKRVVKRKSLGRA